MIIAGLVIFSTQNFWNGDSRTYQLSSQKLQEELNGYSTTNISERSEFLNMVIVQILTTIHLLFCILPASMHVIYPCI